MAFWVEVSIFSNDDRRETIETIPMGSQRDDRYRCEDAEQKNTKQKN